MFVTFPLGDIVVSAVITGMFGIILWILNKRYLAVQIGKLKEDTEKTHQDAELVRVTREDGLQDQIDELREDNTKLFKEKMTAIRTASQAEGALRDELHRIHLKSEGQEDDLRNARNMYVQLLTDLRESRNQGALLQSGGGDVLRTGARAVLARRRPIPVPSWRRGGEHSPAIPPASLHPVRERRARSQSVHGSAGLRPGGPGGLRTLGDRLSTRDAAVESGADWRPANL